GRRKPVIAHLTIVHALSSLHAGTGQGSGVIDLPIAREKATGLPYLPGSSLKGTLNTNCPDEAGVNGKNIRRDQIFGTENLDGSDSNASALQISDQRLLLFPVRSLAGTFAWATSPYILRRLRRDLLDLDLAQQLPAIPEMSKEPR